MAKITVIGSFVMDMVAIMDSFPQAGQTVLGKSIEYFPGGKGVNQCVSVARLGGDVEMIGMLGNDSNGKIFRDILNNDKIKNDNVFTCSKPTAVAQVQINSNGQNRICVIPSANYMFDYNCLEKIDNILQKTELVILQLEMSLDVTKEIIKRAKKYGVKILLNPAPAVVIEKEVLEGIDYITPNETELGILTGLKVETEEEIFIASEKLLNMGVKNVIATLGKRGALIYNDNQRVLIPTYEKVKPIDTVAAGDSFNGALAVAIMEGKTLYEAVRFANAMGSLTIQKKGAIPSIHNRKQLEEFIKENG